MFGQILSRSRLSVKAGVAKLYKRSSRPFLFSAIFSDNYLVKAIATIRYPSKAIA